MAATQLLKFSGVMWTTSRTMKEMISQHLRKETLQCMMISLVCTILYPSKAAVPPLSTPRSTQVFSSSVPP